MKLRELSPYYIPERWDDMVVHMYTVGLGYGFGGSALFIAAMTIIFGGTGVSRIQFLSFALIATVNFVYFYMRGIDISVEWYARNRARRNGAR